MNIPSIINLKTQNYTSAVINKELNKKISSFNITGINDYNNKNNNIGKNNISQFSSNFNKTNNMLINDEELSQKEKEKKICYIKSLIKKPVDKPYDGLAYFRKKPTINYLLKKSDKKENLYTLEENKLCKIPYPLIKIISNRKTPNKSKGLITDLLSAELNNLSAQQKNDIKYKNYKKPIRITKLKIIEDNNNYYRKLNNLSEQKDINKRILNFPYLGKSLNRRQRSKNQIINNSFSKDNYSYLTTNKPCYNNRSIKNILIKSYCGDDINLTEHSTLKKNIAFLKNDVPKKLKLKNEKFIDILKDISLLKSNNHIMAFEK
jgi:hypothetical protein